MKILLVAFYEPDALGVRYLASALLSHGHDAHILQMKDWTEIRVENPPEETPPSMYAANGSVQICGPYAAPITEKEKELFSAFVREWRPDILGFSIRGVFRSLIPPLIPLARDAYEESFIICGGTGPTLEPEYFIDAGADAVLRGEGESSIVALANALQRGDAWRDVHGLSYRSDERMIHTPLSPLIRDLDNISLPMEEETRFSCIEQNEYHPAPLEKSFSKSRSLEKEHTRSVMTSRGCWGSCSYCCSATFRDMYRRETSCATPSYRVRALKNVMHELLEKKDKGTRYIQFWDDFFTRKTPDLINFFHEYRERIALPFSAQFHPLQLQRSPELIDAIADAGLDRFIFGIQSGSPDFSRDVYHRDFRFVDYPALFSSIRARSADVMVQLIGGNPFEQETHFRETLNFIRDISFDETYRTTTTLVYFYLMYLSGSPLLRDRPEIVNMPRDPNDWFRKSLLMDIRLITNDGVFEPIYLESERTRDIAELKGIRKELYDARFRDFFRPKLATLKGRDVYYWGCGDLYHKNKDFLRELNPKAILLDIPYSGPSHIDGIPVRHPQDVADAPLPVIIFSGRPNFIYRKIQRDYPMFSDIVPCPHVIGNVDFG